MGIIKKLNIFNSNSKIESEELLIKNQRMDAMILLRN